MCQCANDAIRRIGLFEQMYKDVKFPLYRFSLDWIRPHLFDCGCWMEPFYWKVMDDISSILRDKYVEHKAKGCPLPNPVDDTVSVKMELYKKMAKCYMNERSHKRKLRVIAYRKSHPKMKTASVSRRKKVSSN